MIRMILGGLTGIRNKISVILFNTQASLLPKI